MSFWKSVKKLMNTDETPTPDQPVSRPVEPSSFAEIKAEPPPKLSDIPPQRETVSEPAPEPAVEGSVDRAFQAVRIEAGENGWGGPLQIQPTAQRHLIYSVTGGGVHPVAQKIADLTGATAFDGFTDRASFEEIAVAVIDCAATIRLGLYPMKGVPTVDVVPVAPTGPLSPYITPENFVSGVSKQQISLLEGEDEQ